MAAASFPLPPDTNKPSVHHTLREINRLANSVGIVSFIRRLLIHFEDYLILPIPYMEKLCDQIRFTFFRGKYSQLGDFWCRLITSLLAKVCYSK